MGACFGRLAPAALRACDSPQKNPYPPPTLRRSPITAVIDLKALGFDGTEPAIFQLAREAVKKDEPAIWNSVLSSPLARKYMVRCVGCPC
jgi:hypothetical protein